MRLFVKHVTHINCRRCGKESFNRTKKICSNCKFPRSKKFKPKK